MERSLLLKQTCQLAVDWKLQKNVVKSRSETSGVVTVLGGTRRVSGMHVRQIKRICLFEFLGLLSELLLLLASPLLLLAPSPRLCVGTMTISCVPMGFGL